MNLKGRWFLDEYGRSVLLRGVNLGGSSKIPFGLHPLDVTNELQTITFVGRPFPLEDADEHYRRLQGWGFNCLRFLITWEAVEHSGPGQYDEAYLDYLYAVVKKAGEYGFAVFIDPHQDVWSRFSGGDGAPAWTLELAGFNLENLDASEAAITMARRMVHSPYGYPPMVWPNNWGRLASCTMFTLFFAGSRFAPQLKINGENIQDFLQSRFVNVMRVIAERMAALPHVIGYDNLNEPSAGYIGLKSLSAPLPVYNSAPQITAFESLFIPAGFPRAVPFITRRGLSQIPASEVILNPDGVSAWRKPYDDIWKQHGVWDVDSQDRPVLLQDDYFAGVDFFKDYVVPFSQRCISAIREVHPGAILFIEGEPGGEIPLSASQLSNMKPIVNASHWYDLLTLITKHYDPESALIWGTDKTVRGAQAVKTSYAQQIAGIIEQSQEYLDGAPTLIGEFGIPYDMDNGAAFQSGDFTPHTQALDAYYNALDISLAHSTQWNYTADNDHIHGDQWNQEDLSIYSSVESSGSTDDGGRAVKGFCRPYVQSCAGMPAHQQFDIQSGHFILRIDSQPVIAAPTVIYVPRIHYPDGARFVVSSGHIEYKHQSQCALWHDIDSGIQTLHLYRD